MRKVNIHEAKTTLSQLVEAAESGETVVLARAGKPVVQLVRLKKKRGIKLGGLKGKLPESDLSRWQEGYSPNRAEAEGQRLRPALSGRRFTSDGLLSWNASRRRTEDRSSHRIIALTQAPSASHDIAAAWD